MARTGREVRLLTRPEGLPQPTDFEVAKIEVAPPGDGELLIRNAFVSVDPYMRGRMRETRSYVPPFALGEPMTGGAVGQVVESRNHAFAEGSWVFHSLGWREWTLSDGRGVFGVDPGLAPVSAYLGVLGMPGLTAYVGLLDIGRPEEGKTLFVSGAAGAVGSVAGQIGRLKGLRVIGSAGGPEKAAWLSELGFDGVIDYRQERVGDGLRRLAPDGIDLYFDNVGGETLEAAIASLRQHGTIVACGAISVYNATEPVPAPRNLFAIVTKRLRMEGFIVSDHYDRLPAFLADMGGWLRDGSVRYRETVVDGIENAPAAFIGLLQGENVGKMLIRVGPSP